MGLLVLDPGSLHCFDDVHALTSRLDDIDPSVEIVVHCHTGIRSAAVSDYLIKQGYPNVKNLSGGIKAWTREIDSSLMRY